MSTKQLKKENQELRDEVSKLTEKVNKLSSELLKTTSKTNEESRQDGRHDLRPDKQLAVEFVSVKYDDLLKVDLIIISRRCEDISQAIEHNGIIQLSVQHKNNWNAPSRRTRIVRVNG